jgi:transcriptional regulator with XRE-family HTH domain
MDRGGSIDHESRIPCITDSRCCDHFGIELYRTPKDGKRAASPDPSDCQPGSRPSVRHGNDKAVRGKGWAHGLHVGLASGQFDQPLCRLFQGAAMKTLGQFLIERRKAQGLSQKEFAGLIKNRDGKSISATYLNYLEHDRGKPPDYLLDQFARVLEVERDVLYFWAQRMPPDIRPGEANEVQVTAAYRAFRRELKSKGGRRGSKRS